MAKIKIVCSQCGSDDVRRDAYAAWSVEAQDWELSSVFDQGTCEVCGDEATLEEVEIEETEEVSITTMERDIIIAALRLWQRTANPPEDIELIASDGREPSCFLTDVEIDQLIETKLNV